MIHEILLAFYYFCYFCYFLDASLTLVDTINITSAYYCSPKGVTQMNGTIYLACAHSMSMANSNASVVMFKAESPTIQSQKPLDGASADLSDIAAGCVCKCLYVADRSGNMLWRVTVTWDGYVVDKFVDVPFPHTLSVSADGRVFVTNMESNKLWIFSQQGMTLPTVDMAAFNSLQHVVERSTGSMLVCQTGADSIVSEVLQESGMMKTLQYYGTKGNDSAMGWLNMPVYMALDMSEYGWLFVIDNMRVVMLNAQFNRITMTPVPGLPHRVSYDSASRFLYVCDGTRVYKYRVLVAWGDQQWQ